MEVDQLISRLVRRWTESTHHSDPHTEYEAVTNQKEIGHSLCQGTNTKSGDKTEVHKKPCRECLPQYPERTRNVTGNIANLLDITYDRKINPIRLGWFQTKSDVIDVTC